jgi:endoglucanase
LQSDTKRKLTAVFCTQEEVGLRGSAVAANQVFADLIINLEGTVSADSEDTDEHKRVTILGDGPAVSIIDMRSIYLKKYYEKLFVVAKENNIPLQYRQTGMGGTDAGSYHTAHSGTPVIGIAVPCRYIHTPVSVFDAQDYCNMVKLVKTFIDNYVVEE